MRIIFSTGKLKFHVRLFKILVIALIFAHPTLVIGDDQVLTLNTTLKTPLGNNNQNGFVDRIASTAFARVGLKIKSFEFPAQRALLDANSGILDGELARVSGIEKFYKNLRKVPEKLMDVEFTLFSITHDQVGRGWDGLANQAVAFINGWKILERNVPTSAEITKVETPEQLFELLRLNRVDFIIYEKWGGIALAKSMNINNINLLSPPLAIKPLHLFLHKKHESFVQPLSNALRELKKNGTYQKFYDDILTPYIVKQ